MRVDQLLPARLRNIGPEAAKFAVVGVLNTVINFAVLNALIFTVLPDGQLKANVVATVVATVASYAMNRHWTFRHRSKSAVHREFTLFVLFNVAGLGIELAVMGATKYGLGLTALWAINAAKLLGLILGTLFRFVTYRAFVFREHPAAEQPTAAAGPTASRRPAVANEFAELTGPLEAEFGVGAELEAELAVTPERAMDTAPVRARRPRR